MVWGGRWEGSSGWGKCVHPWRMHADVWQNQYNILKLKKKKKKRERKKINLMFCLKIIIIIMLEENVAVVCILAKDKINMVTYGIRYKRPTEILTV